MLELDERQLDAITEVLSGILRGEKAAPIQVAADAPDNEYSQLISYINRFIKEYDEFADFMYSLSRGELNSTPPKGKMRVLQSFKSLQASLRHLTWKTQQIAAGDFEQQVDFMGDFSTAFNSMTQQLQQAFTDLKHANAELAEKNRQLRKHQQELALLNQVGQMFSSTLDLDRVLNTVLNQMREQLDILATSFWLRDHETGELICKESIGPGREKILGWRLAAGEGIVGQTALKDDVIMVADTRTEPMHYKQVDVKTGIEIRSILSMPFHSRGEVIGVLNLVDAKPQRFTQADLQLVEPIAAAAAAAVENARFYMLAQQEIDERIHTEEALRQTKDAAEIANNTKSVFLANMSHELRTPLNGILGYAQILKREADMTERQQEGLIIIEQSGQHLMTLINDILDLAKVEAGKIELSPSDFELPAFLHHLSELIRIRAEKKALFFCMECAEDLPTDLHGDEFRLRQVLLNLLGNAVKFTDTGGVTLRVSRNQVAGGRRQKADSSENKKTADRFLPTADLIFEVKDTGVGIAPEQLETIFEPFQQVGETGRQAEGTGLGMAISRKLVQLMGGELSVESTSGRGSTFRVTVSLPEAAIDDTSTTGRNRKIVGLKNEAPTLLIVGDNQENRRVLIDLLSPLGFNMLEAFGGHDALRLAEEQRPRGIITDITMPDMDGLQLIRRIRQSPELQNTTIIATSARVYEEDRQRCVAAGSHDFLPKPIQVEQLFDQLQRHLQVEWVYATDERSGQAGDPSTLPPVLPSPDDIELLLEATVIGDIMSIRKHLDILEQRRPDLQEFVLTLRNLAKNFQLLDIRNFLDSCQSRAIGDTSPPKN